MTGPADKTPLLEVEGLKKHFPVRSGVFNRQTAAVRAVDGISFSLARGETLGLVGESGCGKSTAGRLVLRLIEPDEGSIRFEGRDVMGLSQREMRPLRRHMQLIFQDPYASLNPRLTVREIIEEPLIVHRLGSRADRRDKVATTLRRVGIRPDLMDRYPHEFSGGQRQRIGIARALVLGPKLIVADEPVSALDVSIQASVVNLMAEIQEEFGLAFVMIAHDLAVVEHMSDRVAVMYLGRIVELASDRDIYTSPKHPYTQFLLESVPSLDPGQTRARKHLTGEVPSPMNPPSGCPFHPRCPKRMDVCVERTPVLQDSDTGHAVACHLYGEPAAGPSSVPVKQREVSTC